MFGGNAKVKGVAPALGGVGMMLKQMGIDPDAMMATAQGIGADAMAAKAALERVEAICRANNAMLTALCQKLEIPLATMTAEHAETK